jgi:hypothetical protein
MHPRPSPERSESRYLDVVQLHAAAAEAFAQERYEDAVGLFEVLDSIKQLRPDEREQWKVAQRNLLQQTTEDHEAARLLSRHQRDLRDDDEERRWSRRHLR